MFIECWISNAGVSVLPRTLGGCINMYVSLTDTVVNQISLLCL